MKPTRIIPILLSLFVILTVGIRQHASAQTCVAPPAGFTGFWTGDQSANDFQGTNHGTIEGGATFADGKVGAAFSFDGTDDSVLIPTMNLGSVFSIELWVYSTRTAAFQNMVSNGWTSTNYGALYLNVDQVVYYQGGSARAFTPSGSVPLNTWTHVALTFDGGVARLYLNGIPSGAPSATHVETFNNSLRFGYAVSASDSRFQGRLDDISLYNTTLSGAEILSIFNAGGRGKCVAPALTISDTSVIEGNGGTTNANFTVTSIRSTVAAMVNYATSDGTATAPADYIATSGSLNVPASGTATVTVTVNGDTALEQNETVLVNLSNPVNAFIADGQGSGTIFSDDCVSAPVGIAAWYKGESNANDSVGNNHATLENGTTFAVGNTGQAFTLDGVNDSVLTPSMNLGSVFSVELWIYPTSSSSYQELVSNAFLSNNYGSLYFSGNHLEYWQGGSQRAGSIGVIPFNTWTHVALTYDGAAIRLYVNGTPSGSPSPAHSEIFNNPLRFGYALANQSLYFKGQLDEVTLYNRTLSDTEIQTIYSAFGGGKCGGSGGNTWTGALSSDWHTAGNWSSGIVPSAASADVVIPANGVTNEPSVSSNDPTIGSLIVAANRTLTVSAGRTLTVTGDLINNAVLAGAGTIVSQGSATANSGTISVATFIFSGAGAQELSGSGSFSANTTTITNGSTLKVLSNHQLSGLVIQGGATLDITSITLSVSGALTNSGTFTVTGSTVVANGTTPQTLTNANYRNLTANNPAGVNLGSNATVSHVLTLNSDLATGAFTLTTPWFTATSEGSADVVGNVRCTGVGFFPCAYGNPLNTISFTAGTPPSEITVNLVKSAPADFPSAVTRTYTITPTGGSNYSATLRLRYLDSELNGNSETTLQLWRRDATWSPQGVTNRNSTENWVVKTGVTQFSPWTIGAGAPTSASVSVGGRVLSSNGRGVSSALVRLVSASGATRTAITNGLGYYRFLEVAVGQTYVMSVSSKRYSFAPQVITVTEEMTNLNFVAEP